MTADEITDCLEGVVGLTINPCECIEGDQGDADVSASGYFIDDMEDGIPLDWAGSSQDCGDGSLWDLLERAKREGTQDFLTNFLAVVSDQNTDRYRPAQCAIGEPKKNVALTAETGNFKFIKLTPYRIKGVVLTITGLSLQINTVGMYTVEIREESDFDTVIETIAVDVLTPGVLTKATITEPIVLPMTDQNGIAKVYYLVYDAGGARPYNIKFKCGCTGKPNPQYERFFSAGGGKAVTVEDALIANSKGLYSQGLVVDIRAACSSMDWICPADSGIFKSDKFYRVLAKTLQLHQINKLIGYMVNRSEPNRGVLVEKDQMYGRRNHNNKMIAERLAWMGQRVPSEMTDCYVCADANRITTKAILV